MNHKSYLKGLGIGIIVTALVLIVSGKFNNKVSDEYVIQRAKELGMVESTTLTPPLALADTNKSNDQNNETVSDTNNTVDKTVSDTKTNNTNNEAVSDTNKSNDQTVSDPNDTDDKTESDTNKSNDKTESDTNDSDDQTVSDKITDNTNDETKNGSGKDTDTSEKNTTENGGKVTVMIEIKSGESSESVSDSVAAAGLSQDATEFNKFLCDNGYDKRLRVGIYDIPIDSDYETVSKYLCGIN